MSFSFSSKTVYRYNSPVSGEIEVRDQMGKYVLLVEKVPQSGGIVTDIWKKGVKALPELGKRPNVLLLGLGGGTVVHILKKRWPDAHITGVELDPNILTVARTYFGLDQVTNLTTVTGDAQTIIMKDKDKVTKVNYDLIIVDLYLGEDWPDFVFEEAFLVKLKSLLEKKGVLVANCLLNREGLEKIPHFYQVIKRLFPKTKSLRVVSNELVIAYQN